MRTVVIKYHDTGFTIQDSYGQLVKVHVEFGRAYFTSYLDGDDEAVEGDQSIDAIDAEIEALALLGVGTTYG